MLVKFYSANDFSIGYNLDLMGKIIREYDKRQRPDSINDIISLFNCVRLIESKVYLKKWDSDYIEHCIRIKQDFNKLIGQTFNRINNKNFIDMLNGIDNTYIDDFFLLAAKYNCHERIDADTIQYCLNENLFPIDCLLHHKKLTLTYDRGICEWFEHNSFHAAEIILHVRESSSSREDWFLPNSLTSELIEKIMQDYVDDPMANPNYLELIMKSVHLGLSNNTKFTASKKHKIAIDKMFASGTGVEQKYGVRFDKTQEEYMKVPNDDEGIYVSYGKSFFEEQDHIIILSNFIHAFGYIDNNGRISLVSLESELGIIEKNLFSRSKKDYLALAAFQAKDAISILQMNGYYNILAENSTRLENIIESFFNEYLKSAFGIDGFVISLPRIELTYHEKCVLILPQMDSILKQISQFAERGSIDHELLYNFSDQMVFSAMPSIFGKKYLYAKDNLKTMLFHFFSDQSPLHYLDSEKEYKNFYYAVLGKRIEYNSIKEYAKPYIDYYINEGYLELDENSIIKFKNLIRATILKEFYYKECLNLYRLSEQFKKEVLAMENEGFLYSKATFFSEPEQDYFNYYLTRSEFVNGPDLRNKYVHLGQTSPDDTETTHFRNYLHFLRLIILVILKLHDDLCANEKTEAENE